MDANKPALKAFFTAEAQRHREDIFSLRLCASAINLYQTSATESIFKFYSVCAAGILV